jgi:hypothetical protein
MLMMAAGGDGLYRARQGTVDIVTVPELAYMLVEGRGAR